MSLVFKTPQSTLNTTTGLGQNIGSGCPECPECPEVDLTTGSAEYTENGEYTLTPEGDGFSSVDVTVNVDVTTPYNNGVAAGEAAQKAKLESATFVSNGTYTKEDGYNSVTVNVPSDINNQEKNATPTTSSQEIVADNGYSGLSKVTISGVTSAIDSNITAGNIKEGVTILGVTGTVDPTPDLQAKNVTPTTSQQVIEADSPNYGLSSVTVAGVTSAIDSNISAGNIKKDVAILGVTGTYDPQPTLQDKTVTPTTSQQVISADTGYDGLDEVTVGAVTSAIDQNIVAGNIKSGVTILGVQGTVQEGITPTGNINITDTSSTNVTNYATAQVVDANLSASNIKDGVTILGVQGTYDPQPNLDTLSVTPTTSAQTLTPTSPVDGFNEVVVGAVTSAIDANITAGNIKSGVSILGVSGSYDPQPDLETKTVTYTANDTYTITPTAGKDGLSSVEVTVNVAGGSGTQCPDWSSIGWDCSDVTASSITADLAYTAQKKAEYDNNTRTKFNADDNLKYAPKITLPADSNGMFAGCTSLLYTPQFSGQPTNVNTMFSNNQKLTKQPSFDWSEVTTAASIFNNTAYAQGINYNVVINAPKCTDLNRACQAGTNAYGSGVYTATINAPVVSNVSYLFAGWRRLASVDLTFGVGTLTNVSYMFNNCEHITTVPSFDTSNVTDMTCFFDGCTSLTAIPQYNAVKVAKCNSLINPISGSYTSLTSLGGFTNLGKAFVSTDAAMHHIVNLKLASNLTKASIMNVINNLAAPDDTDVTNAQLVLSATSYALLDAEDIAIATAKNWAVTSA